MNLCSERPGKARSRRPRSKRTSCFGWMHPFVQGKCGAEVRHKSAISAFKFIQLNSPTFTPMNKKGEIILIEDDLDDSMLFQKAYRELNIPNQLTILTNGREAYEYFNNTNKDLFLIIADINMPIMTGIELRDKMQQVGEFKLRTIPFLFLTTGTAADNVIYAYTRSVQGFFLKPTNFEKLKATIKQIIDYWTNCTEPTFHKPQSI